ncbi:hypothetical protein LF887_20785 [Chryseobacterium sp. MEBOG06]|uniref:hypothetical protein n=1 Tax=Chryseobacterium sp. MEBOG06 TaxID=2879938 RepID=UPI001F34CC3D|nr:hypothetical protein [Chryseobacterium sp. MEBOG06]UKB83424.1 hypothetical protein LF887_20785 [Chryseobacterium sp. MEBOG06]
MKKLTLLLLASAATLLIACESTTYEEISDNTPIIVPVKYTEDIKPIMDNNCVSCHSAASFKPLVTYDQVKNNIDGILDRIQRANGVPGKMPQGGSLSATQVNIFIKWKTDGLTEN